MSDRVKKKILFVCLGNICRSPLAEGVMRNLFEKEGKTKEFIVDSAGILGYHQGELPDSRMRAHAICRGYKLESRSRQVREEDFESFDLIIGMDDRNIENLRQLAPTPENERKIHRMTDFCFNMKVDHVPDPYYGGASGFEYVIDIIEDACAGLFNHLASSIQDN